VPLNPGYQPIEAPALTIPRGGLVRSAVEAGSSVDEDTGRVGPAEGVGARLPAWTGGFGFEPQSCDIVGPIAAGCFAEGSQPEKTPGDNPPVVEYVPFAVLGADACSTLDRSRDREARARAQLLATESFQIAREFWDGAVALDQGDPNAFLAKNGASTDLGTAGAVQALAELEQALAACLHGQRGMIHATVYTATIWAHAGLIRPTGDGLLLTAMDTIVVADAGYTGSAPGAAPDDPPVPPADITAAAAAYGTPIVHLRRGPLMPVGDQVSQIDRATNTWTVIVERHAAAFMPPCCLLRVTVDHTDTGIAAGA
jgi:hypothetical protein